MIGLTDYHINDTKESVQIQGEVLEVVGAFDIMSSAGFRRRDPWRIRLNPALPS
jgi:hypothetical protein